MALGGSAGYAAGSPSMAIAGMLMGAAVPRAVGTAMMSRAGQRYLTNQALPGNISPAVRAIANALLGNGILTARDRRWMGFLIHIRRPQGENAARQDAKDDLSPIVSIGRLEDPEKADRRTLQQVRQGCGRPLGAGCQTRDRLSGHGRQAPRSDPDDVAGDNSR